MGRSRMVSQGFEAAAGELDMPHIDDREYFTRRAKSERLIAAAARDTGVADAHLKMAEEYERRVADLPAAEEERGPSPDG